MMRVDELLKDLAEVVNTASGVPLTGKVMVDGEEIIGILNDIETALPDEIKQARWIQNEKDRILAEAKNEYEIVVNDAKRHAEDLVNQNEILTKARARSEELMNVTERNVMRLKMSTYEYIDQILYKFEEKMSELNNMYNEMFTSLEDTFNRVESMVSANRSELKDMAFKTKMNEEEKEKQNG